MRRSPRFSARITLTVAVAASLAMPLSARGVTDGAPSSAQPQARGASSAPSARPRRPVERPPVDAPGSEVRLLVKPAAGVGRARLQAEGRRLGAEVGKSLPHVGWTLVTVPAARADEVAAELKRGGAAASVERDRRIYPAAVPNDPMFPGLWGLHNTGQTGGTADADIDAPEAWEAGTGSSDVVVAVCDTGIQVTHPDLAANVWVNPDEIAGNGVDDDGNGKVDDINGWHWWTDSGGGRHEDNVVYAPADGDEHGTHVAGTIGAVGDNGLGVTGVNHDVSIMSLKTLSKTSGSLFDAADAILYAVDEGVVAINHSWISDGTVQAFEDALDYAARHGVLNIAAAGNWGTSNTEIPLWPASSEATNVIAVAASDSDDLLPGFSNWGTNVDLAAPGAEITSTVPTDSYAAYRGTSMAAPHVTGAAALIRSLHPDATAEEIRARIEQTVDRPGGLAGWIPSGGRLNLAAAVGDFASAPTVTSPTPGEALVRGAVATATWDPAPWTAAGTTYEVQPGVKRTALANGFDAGLSGWTTGGDAPFGVSSTYRHSAPYAAISGDIGHDEISWIQRDVTVPPSGGELRFWYRLDCQDFYDWAYLTVDGYLWWWTVSAMPWTEATIPLPAGQHTLQWGYIKDKTISVGLDALMIDDVRVTGYAWSGATTSPAGSSSAEFVVPDESTVTGALRVRGSYGGRTSGWTVVDGLAFTVDPELPTAPTGLKADASAGLVSLTWDAAPEPDVHSWEVWRAAGAGAFEKRATVSAPAYGDTAVANGTTYRYKVVAVDDTSNRSPDSAIVSATPAATLDRWYGADRYSTAIAVSKATFDAAGTVVLATGEAFPDALSASALAGAYGGPLLLTRKDRVSTSLLAELSRLGAEDVVIVGGTAAVSEDVATALRQRSYGVTRLQGSDRYGTAAAVAEEVGRLGGAGRVFIARGDTFPDALSASPLAYAKRYPVLLVRPDGVPAKTRSAISSLRPIEAVVLGSAEAISDGVEGGLGVPAERWGGSDRYATSALVARRGTERGWASFSTLGVATGSAFPDALGGGAAIGADGGVLLLTAPTTLSSSAASEIGARKAAIDRAHVIGGVAAVSNTVYTRVRTLLGI